MTRRAAVVMTLAVAVTFWILAFLDPQLFFVHVYESLLYLAIAVLLMKFKDRWASVLGFLGPAAWLVVILLPSAWTAASFNVGTAFAILQSPLLTMGLQRPSFAAIIAEGITLVLSSLMIVFSLNRWKSQRMPRLQAHKIFVTCLMAVAVYYGVLILWLLGWKPASV